MDEQAAARFRPLKPGEHAIMLTREFGAEGAPDAVRLFSSGKIDTAKGTFFFTPDSANLVKAEAGEWGNDYSADYEHAILYAGPAPAVAPDRAPRPARPYT